MPPEYRAIAGRFSPECAVRDYIAGMSDDYAIHTYTQLFVPHAWEN
jgi:dGTPase